jgi:hypothetical protein
VQAVHGFSDERVLFGLPPDLSGLLRLILAPNPNQEKGENQPGK